MREERTSAAEAFSRAEMPTDALEEWRYSRIADLDLDSYSSPGDASPEAGSEELIAELLGPAAEGATVIRTVGGRLVSVERRGEVEVSDLASGDEAPSTRNAAEPDPYAVLNRAFAPSWLSLAVAPNSTGGTVVVVHHIGDGRCAAFPRLTVGVGRLAELNVIEILEGGSGAFVAAVADLDVAEGGRLAYTQVQLLDATAWQIASQTSTVGRDASLVSAAVALGGEYARLRTESSLAAPGAEGRLLALYFGSGTQMHDFRTVQHHRAPKTQSELLYKGVVADNSHSVYSGLIRVDKGAAGTNAMQTNRNLVLHDGAHADSVPNLEIEDNDVRCSHASAVGPIAEDERFYLESRGVPPRVADRLIALGFMDELLAQLPEAGLAAPMRERLATKLASVEGTMPEAV